MLYKSFQQWCAVVHSKYPNATIHDARAQDTEGFAMAFNGDEQVAYFDPQVGGTIEGESL